MIRSKEPFDRKHFYQLIEDEKWMDLYWFINDEKSVNITEEDLRLAFTILPKNFKLRNLYNFENRFHPDFFREFADRFEYNAFECVRPHYKNSRLVEEYHKYWKDEPGDQLSCNAFTDVLRYKYDLNYIKRFIRRLQYHRIFNWWGKKREFNLSYEELNYLRKHVDETIWGHM